MIDRLRNLVATRGSWSFRATKIRANRGVLYEDEALTLSLYVLNNGWKIGTVYARFLIASSFDTSVATFDSDRDLPEGERHALRLVDIERSKSRESTCGYTVPLCVAPHHFDIRAQVWTPRQLFKPGTGLLFSDTGWVGGFEVITRTNHRPQVFISYAWSTAEHQTWVQELVEELRKHGIPTTFDRHDLHPGAQATLFMQRGITESDVTILVCSDVYTEKANAQSPGGVGFETILSANEYMNRTPKERERFIPIVRDNRLPARKKVPAYLGSAIYVDMSGADWRDRPTLQLVDTIRRVPLR